jgi:hypothetical protein
MTVEWAPEKFAKETGIPLSVIWDWINGRASVLIDSRDLREINRRFKLISVAAPNASGQGARPRFVPNPRYKYVKKQDRNPELETESEQVDIPYT